MGAGGLIAIWSWWDVLRFLRLFFLCFRCPFWKTLLSFSDEIYCGLVSSLSLPDVLPPSPHTIDMEAWWISSNNHFHPLHLSSGDLEGSAFYGVGAELLHLAFNTCHNLSFSVPLWSPSLLPPALLCLVPLGQRTHPLCGLVPSICSYCSSLTSPPWIMLLFQNKASSERILCVCAGLSSWLISSYH